MANKTKNSSSVAKAAPAPAPAPAPAAPAPAPAPAVQAPAVVADAGASEAVNAAEQGAASGTGEAAGTTEQSTATTATTTPAAPSAPAADATPKATSARPEIAFPITVTLRNHSRIAIAEPVSGAYLAAGGSAKVTLHDEAHASRVFDNLRELKARNRLSDDALTCDTPTL